MASSTLEPVWGSMEYAKFLLLVNVLSCLGASLVYIFGYMVTSDLTYLFSELSGFTGALAGILVGFRQLYPQHKLAIVGLIIVDSRVCWPGSFLRSCLTSQPSPIELFWGTR